MKWLRKSCEVLEYGPFLAALLPTLIMLLAAGVILAGGEGAEPLTVPAVPIYSSS